MATQIFYLEGTVNWAKVKEPVLKYGSKTDYEWTLDFIPDDKDAFKKTGSRKNLGDVGAKLNRATQHIDKNGDIVSDDPPKVLLLNKETGENEPYDGLIGNGSKALVKIAVYDTRMGKGTRLEGLVVLDLVPYGGTVQPTAPITTSDDGEVLPF